MTNIDFTKLNDSELTNTGFEYSTIAGKQFKEFCELNKQSLLLSDDACYSDCF
jgi:hypothetical protein